MEFWIDLWLLSSTKFDCKDNRSITEFELFLLSEYQVRTCWMAEDKVRSKESTISTKISL